MSSVFQPTSVDTDKNSESDSYEYETDDSLDEELDDVELLKSMSRDDLFNLVLTDPTYYLGLIKENSLCEELDILIRRSVDGSGLTIKFRVYPEDKWVEVGYFSEATDDEVIDDFVSQVKRLLGRTRSVGPNKADRHHLGAQLDANNDLLSTTYGSDINTGKLKKAMQTGLTPQEMKLAQLKKNTSSTVSQPVLDVSAPLEQPTFRPLATVATKSLLGTSPVLDEESCGNVKDELTLPQTNLRTKPVEALNSFVAIILNKIVMNLPQLIDIPMDRDYGSLASDLNFISPPEQFKELHKDFVLKIKGYEYLQKIHRIKHWERYPELKEDLINFHRTVMRTDNTLYLRIKKDALMNLLDETEREILDTYSLNIEKIWQDYVKSHDA